MNIVFNCKNMSGTMKWTITSKENRDNKEDRLWSFPDKYWFPNSHNTRIKKNVTIPGNNISTRRTFNSSKLAAPQDTEAFNSTRQHAHGSAPLLYSHIWIKSARTKIWQEIIIPSDQQDVRHSQKLWISSRSY